MIDLYLGFEIVATILETYIFLDFLTAFLGKKYRTVKHIIFFTFSFLFINLYMIGANYFLPQYAAFQDVIVLVLYTMYALLFTRGNLILKIIIPAATITSILLINLFVLYALSILWNTSMGSLVTARDASRVIVLVVTKLLFYITTRLVLRCLKPRVYFMNAKEYFTITLPFLCSVIIIVYFAELLYHAEQKALGFETIIVLISVIILNVASSILFILLVKSNRNKTETTIVKVQLQEQRKMYLAICSAYKNLEILQHDMKNDMLALQSLIHQNRNSEAESFVERYTKTKLEQFHMYVQTGFDILDAVINIKLNYAREQGIEVFCQIIADFSDYEVEDIVSLFSNAIDNAIESSLAQTHHYVSIVIENQRNYLHLIVGNAIDQSVLKYNTNLKTTKKDSAFHGFGTQSMLHIVQKYDGMIDYYESNGVFFVDMLLKNTK